MSVKIACLHCESPLVYQPDITEWWHEGGAWECFPLQEMPDDQLPLFDAPIRRRTLTNAEPGYLLVDGLEGVTVYRVTQDDTTPTSWTHILG